MNKYLILTILILLMFFSCAKEFDRIVFNNIEKIEKDISITESKPIHLWVDLEVEYLDDFSLIYDIRLLKDYTVFYKNTCDAMNVSLKMYSFEKSYNNYHEIKYQGKLGKTDKLEIGKYKLIITPKINGNKYKLSKYDIIIKQ